MNARSRLNWAEHLLQKCELSPVTIWAQGKTHDVPEPWMAYINLSNHCNSLCHYCAHSFAMRETKGRMTFDLFKKIVSELPASVRKVYLIKQGEPFAHPQLEEFTVHLAEARPDVHIAMHTNAIIARKERVEKILPHVHSFGISMSAMSKETYHSVHEVDKFDVVMRNLEGISDIASSIPKENRPHVFIDYVLSSRNNHEEQENVVDFFSERFQGLNPVDFHYMFNYTGEIEEANLKAYDDVPYERFPVCVFPWSSITFLHDGKISYCFVEPRENRFLGDISEESFQDIWNGSEYQTFRERMVNRKFDDLADDGFYCHKCSWLWSPHSMAPRNLAYGYATEIGHEPEQLRFGDLLQAFPDETFERGVEFYLSGEIHQAIACLNVVKSTSHEPSLQDASDELLSLCQTVLSRYKDLSLWFDTLAKEGRTPDSRRNAYYSI